MKWHGENPTGKPEHQPEGQDRRIHDRSPQLSRRSTLSADDHRHASRFRGVARTALGLALVPGFFATLWLLTPLTGEVLFASRTGWSSTAVPVVWGLLSIGGFTALSWLLTYRLGNARFLVPGWSVILLMAFSVLIWILVLALFDGAYSAEELFEVIWEPWSVKGLRIWVPFLFLPVTTGLTILAIFQRTISGQVRTDRAAKLVGAGLAVAPYLVVTAALIIQDMSIIGSAA